MSTTNVEKTITSSFVPDWIRGRIYKNVKLFRLALYTLIFVKAWEVANY
ncbi:hypothetical protein NIES4074_27120 [Cylindrospermum sp. NIES-4074]|nr:hypothetical protein NIES4074_27120 [Cylindrospermum sp. NIES-4074]